MSFYDRDRWSGNEDRDVAGYGSQEPLTTLMREEI